jgi:hypothetical protein
MAPLSTATVTSQQPTLRWLLAPGTDGARVELCRDRAMTTSCTSFDATGASGRPGSNLAPGVWFWRVLGRSGASAGTTGSVVWQFVVGARSAGVDASWGTTLDVNGDGYADVVVGAFGENSETGRAYVYLGSATGLGTTPATTLTGPGGASGNFGESVASAGDVNAAPVPTPAPLATQFTRRGPPSHSPRT